MTHPILAAASVIEGALKEVGEVNPAFMTTQDKAAAIRDLAVLEGQLAELRLRVLAAAGDVAESTAARDAAGWMSAQTRCRPEAARDELRLAEALDRRWRGVATAAGAGAVNLAQARVIVRCLDDLPKEVPAEVVDKAEAAMVDYAARFAPKQLAMLGRRILEAVAPELVDEQEGRRLKDLESAARRRTRFAMRRMGDGTTTISGRVPDATATRLATYLESFANPRRDTEPATDDGTQGDPVARLTYPRRMGEALCRLLECVDPARLPVHGGDATTVIVTISLDTLRGQLGTADLLGAGHIPGDVESAGAGESISAGEARRLACNANLIPAVLGGNSEVLDLGRAQRLYTPAQRRALLLRDKTCRAEGCDIPGTWAEAHHWVPWSQGGQTNLDDGVLLCSHHHHRVHDTTYHAQRQPNGDITFARYDRPGRAGPELADAA